MARRALLLLVALATTGCVERRMLIVSDPPGATVFVNGENVGLSPASVPFTHYGKYDITLVRDGYQTTTERQPVRRPWYQFFPIDFFAEVLYPGHVQDNHPIKIPMQPLTQPRGEDILQKANEVRQRGQTVGAPGSD